MSKPTVRLGAAETRRAIDGIDPIAVLAEELVRRTIQPVTPVHAAVCSLVASDDPDRADLLVLDCPALAVRYALPAASLRTCQVAALVALAARELVIRGGVTVAMLGLTPPAVVQLAVIARHVPDISHVAVYVADLRLAAAIDARLLDELALRGIGLSVLATVREAVFGANLVVVSSGGLRSPDLEPVRLRRLVRGAVLVNATDEHLPATFVDHVDQVYDVDDLGRLLAGTHGGRRGADDIVLVDVLGSGAPSTSLAHEICRTGSETCG